MQRNDDIIDMMPEETEVFDVRISVSKVFSEHYQKVIEHRDAVMNDPESENKDISSAINSATAVIKELSKIQSEIYNSEKFAVLQQIIVNELKKVSPELQAKVLERLEERYETII